MDPVTAAAAGQGGQMVGAMMQNQWNIASASKGRKFARNMQQDAQDYNLKMFRNRYQNTTKDMIKAGLNPMLAYMQGGGSPSAVGASSASGGAAPSENIAEGLTSTALATKRLKTELENMEKVGQKLDIEKEKVHQEKKAIEAENVGREIDAEMLKKYPLLKYGNTIMKFFGLGINSGKGLQNMLRNKIQTPNNPRIKGAMPRKRRSALKKAGLM